MEKISLIYISINHVKKVTSQKWTWVFCGIVHLNTSQKQFIFCFKVSPSTNHIFTKRDVLSQIARIFDPLGLLGPVISKAKFFMQQLWLLKLELHEKLPVPVDADDASEKGFGAVIYVSVIKNNGDRHSQLLCSKSRVAPLKTLTIPRFLLNARSSKNKRVSGPLSLKEINQAEFWLIKLVQKAEFSNEIKSLLRGEPVHRSSKLSALNCFVDENNIRVGGRLQNSPLSKNKKHPIVLPTIHLDFVSDLTSKAFIACLKRFFGRGKSSKMFSDNGKTFVGANIKLKKLHDLVKAPDETLVSYFNDEHIDWNFTPPTSPNFGGLWESGVKSFKTHLKRVAGNSNSTLEEFITLLAEIEAVLNSRPLSSLSSYFDDFETLSPGHFLIGRPVTAIVEPELINIKENRLTRWQRVNWLSRQIWKVWKRNYLNNLYKKGEQMEIQ
ncbi:integrase catalytic domain-containing protein [Trichonephila clavipes]|nr:integrase catalytic domain-containing protein [Trichonephila clavipes]